MWMCNVHLSRSTQQSVCCAVCILLKIQPFAWSCFYFRIRERVKCIHPNFMDGNKIGCCCERMARTNEENGGGEKMSLKMRERIVMKLKWWWWWWQREQKWANSNSSNKHWTWKIKSYKFEFMCSSVESIKWVLEIESVVMKYENRLT